MDVGLNPRLASVVSSPTAALMERARELKKAGGDIVDLAGGEPDMPPALAAREAAIERLRKGELSYGPVSGLAELTSAIAEQLSRRYGRPCAPSEILVGNGAKQVLFEALFATIAPGDEVIIPAPYWVSYPAMTLLAGGIPKIVNTSAQSGFKLTPHALASSLTPHTRWLILNSPSNPTGAVYTYEELAALCAVVRAHPRVLVLSDAIYEDLVYDDAIAPTLAAVASDLSDRSLICSGFSKGHAMTGLRVGYAWGPSWLIRPMTKVQSHLTSGGCVVGQHAAAHALAAAADFPGECRALYARRRKRGLAALASTNRLDVLRPDGAFYFWIGVERLLGGMSPGGHRLGTDEDVCDALLTDAGLAVVPGTAFGTAKYLRMSFAAADDTVLEGCRRLVQFAQSCGTR